MKVTLPMHGSPRCTETSKRKWQPSQAQAVKGWMVCRFHDAPRRTKAGAQRGVPGRAAYGGGGMDGGAAALDQSRDAPIWVVPSGRRWGS